MKEIQGTHQIKGVTSSDEYYTPKHIIDSLGCFDLDPATPKNPKWQTARVMYTKEDDGLNKEWFGRVFLNPPYSKPLVEQFIKKMAEHGNGIALIMPKLGTKLFRETIYPSCSAIYILAERIKFYDENWKQQKSPICQSMLVAFGKENIEAIRNSGLKGMMLIPERVEEEYNY